MRLAQAFTVSAVLLSLAPDVRAESDEVKRASALIDQAMAAEKAGRYEDARQGFAEAYRTVQHSLMLYNLGLVERLDGKKRNAVIYLRRFLVIGQNEKKEAEKARRLIKEIEAEIGPVPADAKVAPPLDPPLFGPREPKETVETKEEPAIADTKMAVITEPGDSTRAVPVGTWVLGGVAVATLGAGIGFGAAALSGESKCESASGCSQSAADRANRFSVLADVSYAVAGLSTVGAVLWWLASDREDDSQAPIGISEVPDGMSVTFSGTF